MVVSPLASGPADRMPPTAAVASDRSATGDRIGVSLVASIFNPGPACQAGNALLHPPHPSWQPSRPALAAGTGLNDIPLTAPSSASLSWRRLKLLRTILARITDRLCETLEVDSCAILVSHDGATTASLATSGSERPQLPTIGGWLLRATASAGGVGALMPGPVRIAMPDASVTQALYATAAPDGDAGFVALVAACPADRRLATTERDLLRLATRLAGIAIDHARANHLAHADWRYLETALDLTEEAIVTRDADGAIVHMNAAARALLGFGLDDAVDRVDESELLQALDLRDQWGQRITPEMLPHHRIHASQPAPDLVVSGQTSVDQPRHWMLLHAQGLTDGHGDIALVFTVLRDFSVIQRHDAAQRVRGRIASLLRATPLNLQAIEREIATFVEGSCSITLFDRADAMPGRASGAPRRSARQAHHEDEAQRELRLLCGHLHLGTSPAHAGGARRAAGTHVAAIAIEGDGIPFGHMTCRRDRDQRCFDAEELGLLHELAGQLGLAVAVDRLRESLDAGERTISDISRRLQTAEEAERRRIALSIHDGLAQVAASVCQQLEILAHRFAPSCDDESVELERAQALAHRTVREARMLIAGLRPVTLDKQGLGPAVLEEIMGMRADGWTVRFVDGVSGCRYRNDIELDLYRVVQESLSNIRKHAGMVPVEVVLDQTGSALHVEIRDHGAGFEPAATVGTSSEHIGLDGMRERIEGLGGTFTIESTTGRGTRVTASVPV
jgi:signal transduction histidine kinase/PAS domain-containing protein